ncbi:MAG: gliding motility lipoprotein GldD [Bacteroidia bacterium]
MLAFWSCSSEPVSPKPYAFHRIQLPERDYVRLNTDCPFSFELPGFVKVSSPPNAEHPCWMNLEYHEIKATIHLSYKPIASKTELGRYIDDSQRMTFKHTIKASSIEEIPIHHQGKRLYGLFYRVGGNAASNSQFYITDSTRHFVRGAMYFMAEPRADSLAPVIDYMLDDVMRIVESFQWE